MSRIKNPDFDFKIILIGESGVGKSALTVRYTKNIFRARSVATVVVDSASKDLVMRGKKIRLTIWDTAGQERFRAVVSDYFRNADGVLLVYDVTNLMTFNQITSWLMKVRELCENATVLIVGNKTDHPLGKSVARKTVKHFARDEGLEFMETSAKSGENVERIFEYLSWKILEAKNILPPEEFPIQPEQNNLAEISDEISSSQESLSTDQTRPGTSKVAESQKQPQHIIAVEHNRNVTLDPNISETEFIDQKPSVQPNCAISNNHSKYSSCLPPIVPLSGDFIKLHVERRRRTSTGSVISMMPEAERNIRLHEHASPQKPTSSCC